MAIDSVKNLPFTSVVRGEGGWLYSWADVGGPYRVSLNGRLMGSSTVNSFLLASGDPVPPALEVTSMNKTLGETFPASMTVQWYVASGVDHYLVEGLSSGGWRRLTDIPGDIKWVLAYTYGPLTVGAEHSVRVTAKDRYGAGSDPLTFTELVVAPPADPGVSVTYDGGTVVIDA